MKTQRKRRAPLTREHVLREAMRFADEVGLEALSMRELGKRLGVEAMSLYKHVKSKDDLLDGLVERVMSQMALPSLELGWREALRERALSARAVLLRHRWAAMLIESRLTPTPARLALHERVLQVLRRAGFSVELAYGAYLTLDSHLYGFVLQEVWWPFDPGELKEVATQLAPAISPTEYPALTEVMGFAMRRGSAMSSDFAFGLELILEGLARARRRG